MHKVGRRVNDSGKWKGWRILPKAVPQVHDRVGEDLRSQYLITLPSTTATILHGPLLAYHHGVI